MLRCRPELAEISPVVDWARLGRPVIARRPLPGDRAGETLAALPLPPSHGKQRIALAFPPGSSLAPMPAVSLREAAPAAPARWQATIEALLRLSVLPSVFGALLWEHATGLPYLTPASDLDLLWPVRDRTQADTLLAALLRLDSESPVRLDGELVLPDGSGVHWREYGAAAVLVKTMEGAALRSRAELFRPAVPA